MIKKELKPNEKCKFCENFIAVAPDKGLCYRVGQIYFFLFGARHVKMSDICRNFELHQKYLNEWAKVK